MGLSQCPGVTLSRLIRHQRAIGRKNLDLEYHIHHAKSTYRRIVHFLGIELQGFNAPSIDVVDDSSLSSMHTYVLGTKSCRPSPRHRQSHGELKPGSVGLGPSCGKGGGGLNSEILGKGDHISGSLQRHFEFPASSIQPTSSGLHFPYDLDYYKSWYVVQEDPHEQ